MGDEPPDDVTPVHVTINFHVQPRIVLIMVITHLTVIITYVVILTGIYIASIICGLLELRRGTVATPKTSRGQPGGGKVAIP